MGCDRSEGASCASPLPRLARVTLGMTLLLLVLLLAGVIVATITGKLGPWHIVLVVVVVAMVERLATGAQSGAAAVVAAIARRIAGM